MSYIPRSIEPVIQKYLHIFPVIGITGPRQSGKSTLLKHLFSKTYTYVSFDDYRMVEFFTEDPERFFQVYSQNVIFDEVQKVPQIFSYIKRIVDNERDIMGRFILTGSAQFSFIKNISESLAGRIGLLSLLPFGYPEIPVSQRSTSLFSGSYPELILQKFQYTKEWYGSYIETYIQKDVREISNIGDLRDFRRFLSLLAANASQSLNMNMYAKNIGVSVPTIKRWISVLEASYIIFLLPPYYKNFGKRIVKSPKIYFYDTGIVSYLTGVLNQEMYEKGPMAGSIFENYILSEIQKSLFHIGEKKDIFYYRTSHGEEIDFIIDSGNQQYWGEIKKSSTFKTQMIKPLEKIKPEKDIGVLVYNGEDLPYTPDISIQNYQTFLQSVY